MTERLCVGVVVGAHGIKGQIRIKSFTADPADLTGYGPLQTPDGQSWRLSGVSVGLKGVVTAKLEGVNDRTQAEALKGVKFYVGQDALPALEEEEFYVADLVGLTATDFSSGAVLGKITAVYDFGAGDILEVGGAQGDLLVPFTKRVVPVVDIKAGRVVIDPPVLTEMEDDEEDAEKGPAGD